MVGHQTIAQYPHRSLFQRVTDDAFKRQIVFVVEKQLIFANAPIENMKYFPTWRDSCGSGHPRDQANLAQSVNNWTCPRFFPCFRQTLQIVDDGRPTRSRAMWRRAGLTADTIVAAAEHGRTRLRADVVERLEHDGLERALIYAVLVTTGLRKGELAALTVGDVLLDEPQPVIVLPAADAKKGERATLPLRADIASRLRAWIDEKNETVCRQRVGVAGVAIRPANLPLFNVPTGLIRILDRDLAAAGIPKRDDRSRTVDVHALRHTFATHLVAAGVAPRTAQAAMRHSSLELTMQLYTDPRLLDVAGALASLPALPTADAPLETSRATGTDDARAVARGVALTPVHTRQNVSLPVPSQRTHREASVTRNPYETRTSRQNPTSSGRT